jgi:hypothetical protein
MSISNVPSRRPAMRMTPERGVSAAEVGVIFDPEISG